MMLTYLFLISSILIAKEFERSRAFLFLSDIKGRFQTSYRGHAHSALPYAMNTEFSKVLAAQMVKLVKFKHSRQQFL
jgi:Regulated-SNARE-like domain